MKGYGILLAGGLLAEDFETGRPFFARTKREALRAIDEDLPDWLAAWAAPVKVEVVGNTYRVANTPRPLPALVKTLKPAKRRVS